MAFNKLSNTAKTLSGAPKIAALFFDMDNTLIPTRKGDSKACRKLTEILQDQHGLSHEEADKTTSSFLQSFRSCPDNPQTTLDSWRSYLWSQALPDNWKHLSDDVYKLWLQLRYKYLALTPEYQSLLNTLGQQYLLGLITNGPSNAQWEKIQKLNLSHYFDCILVSSDLPWEKPNPNIFLAACNFLSVKPHQCVMIGDKLETDIQGGKDAKFGATIWIPLNPDKIHHHNSSGQRQDDQIDVDEDVIHPVPDLIVKNLVEILNYVPIRGGGSSGGGGVGVSASLNSGPSGSGISGCSSSSSTSSNSSSSSGSCSSSRRHSQPTSMPSSLRKSHQRRVFTLPTIDFGSDNSSDGS